MNLGFIGTGVMGTSMARHLMKAGYALTLHSRTKAKAESLIKDGATWADTPSEVCKNSEITITMLGFPDDVEAVYLDKGGLVETATEGQTLIDMTTSKPSLAEQIYDKALHKNVATLDAPVSGGDIGAREAKLTIMVGGDKDVYDSMLPLFKCMGKNIVYQGQAGSGQHTKMCNQIVIASTMMGMCEALSYSKVSGLDPETVLKSIGSGAAGSWSLDNLAPRILKGDFAPGFFIKHFIKDMEIALTEASYMGLDTPGLEQALELYQALAQNGHDEEGTQALYKWYTD